MEMVYIILFSVLIIFILMLLGSYLFINKLIHLQLDKMARQWGYYSFELFFSEMKQNIQQSNSNFDKFVEGREHIFRELFFIRTQLPVVKNHENDFSEFKEQGKEYFNEKNQTKT